MLCVSYQVVQPSPAADSITTSLPPVVEQSPASPTITETSTIVPEQQPQKDAPVTAESIGETAQTVVTPPSPPVPQDPTISTQVHTFYFFFS